MPQWNVGELPEGASVQWKNIWQFSRARLMMGGPRSAVRMADGAAGDGRYGGEDCSGWRP